MADCGPTCLRIIADYYGRKYSGVLLRQCCFVTNRGTNFNGLIHGAEHIPATQAAHRPVEIPGCRSAFRGKTDAVA